MKLENKVAVVTGGSSGMGKEIVKVFLNEGAVVYALDINKERLEALKDEIANEKLKVSIVNVADKDEVETLIDEVVGKEGKLDILVNNAGIMDDMMPVGEVKDDLWNKVLAVNLNGPMYLIRKSLEYMLKEEKGNIINIISVGGLFGARAGAAYTTSKHALVGLTKNTAFMYANKGIRCNGICPGAVATNIGETMRSPSQFGMERAMSGMGTNPKTGEALDIAKVTLFLASDDSDFINGTTITADAGWTAY